jgi:hypothetical protein
MARGDRPRSFAEVVAATDPAELERIACVESFKDGSVESIAHADVQLQEDRDETGAWIVDYQDGAGAMYVTIFTGPAAESRARDYFKALKTGGLKIIREGKVSH